MRELEADVICGTQTKVKQRPGSPQLKNTPAGHRNFRAHVYLTGKSRLFLYG